MQGTHIKCRFKIQISYVANKRHKQRFVFDYKFPFYRTL